MKMPWAGKYISGARRIDSLFEKKHLFQYVFVFFSKCIELKAGVIFDKTTTRYEINKQ